MDFKVEISLKKANAQSIIDSLNAGNFQANDINNLKELLKKGISKADLKTRVFALFLQKVSETSAIQPFSSNPDSIKLTTSLNKLGITTQISRQQLSNKLNDVYEDEGIDKTISSSDINKTKKISDLWKKFIGKFS